MLLAIRHYAESHRLALRQTVHNLKASPLAALLSVALISVALALPGTLWVILHNVAGLATGLEQPATFSVYVAPQTAEASLNDLSDLIAKMEGVAQVRIIDAQESLNYFKEQYGMEHLLMLFDKNPFPAVIEIAIKPEHSHGIALDTLLFNLKQQHAIERIETNAIWRERLDALIAFIDAVVWSLAILFISTAIVMISSLMRTEMIRRADEVEVLRLLGATEIFIRRPFFYTAWAYGLIGGLGAVLAIVVVSSVIHAKLQQLIALYHGGSLAGLDYFMISTVTLGVAILVCLCATGIAFAGYQAKRL